MGFRFFRRFRIAPGITLNLSKSGPSVSMGPRGAKVTVGPGGVRKTLGLPGTGLHYTQHTSWKKVGAMSGDGRPTAQTTPIASPAENRLNLGFFKRLFTPVDEQAFVEGLKAFTAGDEASALTHLQSAIHMADAAFLTGFIALTKERYDEAVAAFEHAERNHDTLGKYFHKYGVALDLNMPITDELDAHIQPNRRGLLLGLVEALQEKKEYLRAAQVLRMLRSLDPDDVVVQISLAELLLEADPNNRNHCNEIVQMTAETSNESPVHAALLLYKSRALLGLGTATAARDTLTAALRRTKDRSRELLLALRYERALVYNQLSERARARSDLEKIFAEAPDYEDVRQRLEMDNHGRP